MDLISIRLSDRGELLMSGSPWVLLGVLVFLLGLSIWRRGAGNSLGAAFEIDEAEIGIGNQKIKVKPNNRDLQVAYSLWIELSTRKIGLPIDYEHDTIAQIYDSWYEFFKVTRGLLKDIPASKLRGTNSTQRLIRIAIEVLNEGIRPHLTKYQSRFRHWMDRQSADSENAGLGPQELQRRFPDYEELRIDLEKVSTKLIHYRQALHRLVFESADNTHTKSARG